MAPARTTAAARQISSMSSEPLLTEREAAEYLNIPSETLRYYRWQGTGPRFIKIGRYVRYRPSDVEAWLVERTSA